MVISYDNSTKSKPYLNINRWAVIISIYKTTNFKSKIKC